MYESRRGRPRHHRFTAALAPLAVAATLAGCGSDDGAAPVAPAATLTLGGTAATGAAIAGGTVDAKCATGSGSATTAADGGYAMAIEGGALPCSLRVTSTDGATVLHSAATGSGDSARANLTPATELAMAQLHGRNPADAHAAFDAAALTPAAVQAAADAARALLAGAGIQLAGNPVSDALAVGDANDRALDQLKAALAASGTSLAAVVQAVAAAASGEAAPGAAPSLPPASLLAAAAPNCAALRSGKYRLVFVTPGDAGSAATDAVTFDAPTLTATLADGETSQLTADGDCRYKLPNGGEMAVSPAGVLVLRSFEDGGFVAGIGFPEQAHPVSVLAGTWNYLGLGDSTDGGGPVHLYAGAIGVGSDGRATDDLFCDNLRDCVAETPDARMTFTANPAGGFDFDGSRAFVYRAGSGELLVVTIDEDGSFALATRKVARTLPEIGAVSRSLNFAVTPQYAAPFTPTDTENTTVAHAGDGLSYVRRSVLDFGSGVTRPETVQLNQFLEGFLRRVPETVTASDGSASVVGEWLALPLRGMGLTPVAIVGNGNLVLSVTKP
jgi:hypothetical protein